MTSIVSDHHVSQRRFRYTLVWGGYWLLLFVIMHVPITAPVSLVKGSDKIAHFSLYGLLAVLGGIRHRMSGSHNQWIRVLVLWAFVFAAYGALDEYLQTYVGRTCDAMDWVADVCGIATGTVVIGLSRWRKHIKDR